MSGTSHPTAQWWKEDKTGGHWSNERLPRISKIVLFLEHYRWGRTLLSRSGILYSLLLRMKRLCAEPVGWRMQFRGDLAGHSDRIWPHVCSADMQSLLGPAGWADFLDYKTAEEMWRRGAEWAFRNRDNSFSIPKHLASVHPTASPFPADSSTEAN
jgi:hypothetical protein